MNKMKEESEKKKILITASTFPRYQEDTEPRFIYDLAKELANYYDITVMVPCAPGAKKREVMQGVKVIRYRYFPIRSLETLCYPGAIVSRIKQKKVRVLLVPWLFLALYMNLIFRKNQYDLIHAHWLIPQGIIQSFVSKVPYIVTGHGADVTSLNGGVMRRLKRRCLRRAAGVTVVSKHLQMISDKIYSNKCQKVISMGCEIESFSPENRIEQFYNQQNQKVVLFVGRLAEKKGVRYLIDAMQYVDAKLIIAGDGPLKEELMDQARKLFENKPDKIYFIGAKTHAELAKMYASADIFVAPSITAADGDQEGFGLVILEAMASGLAVVASSSGGIKDLITDGKNGLLSKEKDSTNIAEKINQLLQDSKLAKKLADEAIVTAREYDYRNIAKKYVVLYEECMKK